MNIEAKTRRQNIPLTPSGLSREGIPWKDYRWVDLILTFIPMLAIYALMRLWALGVKDKPAEDSRFPSNAILVMFHQDVVPCIVADKAWKRVGENFKGHLTYLGFHGWLSYLTSAWPYHHGYLACRYDLKKGHKPMDVIMAFIRKYPDSVFALRTDAGGPYGKVRGSVIKMALETGRPIVGIRQSSERNHSLLKHDIPAWGSTVTTRFTRVITNEELQSLDRDEALATVQKEMDRIS